MDRYFPINEFVTYKRGAHSSLDKFAGQTKKTQQADFTEQNLEYFKKATWKIKKDTYDKVKSCFDILLSILLLIYLALPSKS